MLYLFAHEFLLSIRCVSAIPCLLEEELISDPLCYFASFDNIRAKGVFTYYSYQKEDTGKYHALELKEYLPRKFLILCSFNL